MRPTFYELTQLNANFLYKQENEVENLIDAIIECGYEWSNERKMFVHPETQEGINTKGLHEFNAESLKKTYTRAWGNPQWLNEERTFEFYVRITKFGLLLFLLCLISFLFIKWEQSIIGLITSLLILISSYKLSQSTIKKRLKREGSYIDVKKLKWCKNCRHLKKTEFSKNGFLFVEEIVDIEKIPCKIYNDTNKLWADYFNLPTGERAIFPKQCTKWEK